MYSFLRGKLVESLPTRVILDVNGVGFEILIPLSTFDKLPSPGETAHILVHLVVREDEHVLFGFSTQDEKDLFTMLIKHVTGVGPKLALALLSGCSPPQFRSAVVAGDITALSKIKGLGKKTAERIFLELKDKVGVSEVWAAAQNSSVPLSSVQHQLNDAILALIALGYKQPDALKALQQIEEKMDVGIMVREALKRLQ